MFHHLNISILGIGLKVSIKSDYIALRIYRCLFRCKFLSRIMTSPEITGWKVKMREIDWNKQEWMERFVSVKVKVIISIQERLEDNFLVCLGLASTKTHQQQNIKLSLFVVICRTVHLFWDWVTKYCRSSIALHMVNWSSATKISSAPFIYLSHTVKSAISWSGEKLKPPFRWSTLRWRPSSWRRWPSMGSPVRWMIPHITSLYMSWMELVKWIQVEAVFFEQIVQNFHWLQFLPSSFWPFF